MDPHSSNEPPADDAPADGGLAALVVTYDMRKLIEEARREFDVVSSDKELLDQNAIGDYFNLGGSEDARN